MDVLDLIRKVGLASGRHYSRTGADLIKENIKPIINHIFDNYRSRLEALGQRPYLRAFIQGLTTRWEQNNEPPPAPPQLDAEGTASGSASGWKTQAQEEDYFNGSDEEETPKRPNKRQKQPIQSKPTTTSTRGRSPSAQRSPNTRSKPSLGLDYDDGSDSDGSNGTQSPRQSAAVVTAELEDDLGDVAMRMRAKRQREEEDDEGFAGLLGIAKAAGGGSLAKKPDGAQPEPVSQKPTTPVKVDVPAKTPTPTSAAKKEKEKEKEANTPGKRLKLHLGFGKKK
jgi:protein phosphatase-4 regulatory subunit 3